MGLDYGLNESNVQRNIEKIEGILLNSGYFRIQGKRVLISSQNIESIRIDVTECAVQRPKKSRTADAVRNGQKIRCSSKQKRKYSGKKKRHTRKVQIVENAHTQEIISLNFANDASHDFDLYKKSELKIHRNIKLKVDKGYVGILAFHSNTEIPKKSSKLHPLTKSDKKLNRQKAKERVGIEHTNRSGEP